jgi:hypothetical protein
VLGPELRALLRCRDVEGHRPVLSPTHSDGKRREIASPKWPIRR